MGKQYNKTIKRRRREAYLDRKKEGVKAAAPKLKTKARPAKKTVETAG